MLLPTTPPTSSDSLTFSQSTFDCTPLTIMASQAIQHQCTTYSSEHFLNLLNNYTNLGAISVPGVTNLFFSVYNMFNAVSLFFKGLAFTSGELVRDSLFKFTAAIVTLCHAAATLGILLSPYITELAALLKKIGTKVTRNLNIAGIAIAGIELLVRGWQLVRQCLFDSNFEYRDILHTEFNLEEGELKARLQEWKALINQNRPKIEKFLGTEKTTSLLAELNSTNDQNSLEELKAIQLGFKVAFYDRNFCVIRDNYFSISSESDQAYINQFDDKNSGKTKLSAHKLIQFHRRMQCPRLSHQVNKFVIQNHNHLTDCVVSRENLNEATPLFKKVKHKSRQIKIIHAIAIIGLIAIAISFSFATAGVGTPAVIAALFWGGWGITLIAGILESCTLQSENLLFDPRYLIPSGIRNRICSKDVGPVDCNPEVIDLMTPKTASA